MFERLINSLPLDIVLPVVLTFLLGLYLQHRGDKLKEKLELLETKWGDSRTFLATNADKAEVLYSEIKGAISDGKVSAAEIERAKQIADEFASKFK